MCVACESNNLQLLLQVQRSLSCLGRTCAVMPKGQIEELHADQLWRDPAARRSVAAVSAADSATLPRADRAKVEGI
ncbi:ANKRD17 [Symbiodinium microadriaticum]|nr:ANKRD17 [Symbiodinium microadriaticum]